MPRAARTRYAVIPTRSRSSPRQMQCRECLSVPDSLPRGSRSAGRPARILRVLGDVATWRWRLEPFADLAVAVLAVLLSMLPLFYARDCGCDPTPAWGFVLVVAQAVPLVWRRQFPLPASLASGLLT